MTQELKPIQFNYPGDGSSHSAGQSSQSGEDGLACSGSGLATRTTGGEVWPWIGSEKMDYSSS